MSDYFDVRVPLCSEARNKYGRCVMDTRFWRTSKNVEVWSHLIDGNKRPLTPHTLCMHCLKPLTIKKQSSGIDLNTTNDELVVAIYHQTLPYVFGFAITRRVNKKVKRALKGRFCSYECFDRMHHDSNVPRY